MTSIAIIGLGSFGCRVADELLQTDTDLIVVDKDRDVVEKYKGTISNAYITDAINEESLRKILPEDLSAAVIDLGSQLETSILVTNHLHKMGVRHIVVKARSDDHGEILKLVGATDIVYPDFDAALRIAPMLVSASLFNYMQLSQNFALAEVEVKPELEGKSLADSGLRQKYGLNLVAIRQNEKEEFSFVNTPQFTLEHGMILLVAGTDDAIKKYLSRHESGGISAKNASFFRRRFGKK